MKRRDFMNWVGVGFMATSLPVAIAACTPKETAQDNGGEPQAGAPVKVDSSIREDGFAALGTVADLDSQGFLAKVGFIAGQVIVIRDPANAESVVALNSLCTHQGCTVEWKDNMFACPCHGSTFNTDGSVADGPAEDPLGTYEAKIDGDLVLIKAR